MEVFARVADAGSFSEAARRLGLSKSVVSRHVIALENQLGVRLLNRTTRRLSLTEVGAAYHAWCTRIAADVAEAELSAGRLQSEPRGRLKVNAPMSFGYQHLAPAIPDFLGRYPDVRIEMTMNDRYVDLVDEGFDVAVRIGRLADSSLIARRLAPSRTVVCGAPKYFREHGVPATPDDLADHNCLIYSYQPSNDLWRFTGAGREYAVRVDGNLRANNGDALRAAVLRGLGIALLPTFMIGGDLQAGVVTAVLSGFEAPEASIYAVYPHNRHMSAKLRAFVDFLAVRFGPEPYWDRTG